MIVLITKKCINMCIKMHTHTSYIVFVHGYTAVCIYIRENQTNKMH